MLALGIACTVAAVAWAYLAVGHGGYWRTSQRLPSATSPSPPGEPSRWPEVVAVVPARNEAAMLPAVLPTLFGQDYPGALTVVVVDDCSSDGTAGVAAELRPRPGPGPRALRVVEGTPLPPGWAGKVWAMAQGLDAAGLPSEPAAADGGAGPGAPGTCCSPTPISPGTAVCCGPWWAPPRPMTGTWSHRWRCCGRPRPGSASSSRRSSTSSLSSIRSPG